MYQTTGDVKVSTITVCDGVITVTYPEEWTPDTDDYIRVEAEGKCIAAWCIVENPKDEAKVCARSYQLVWNIAFILGAKKVVQLAMSESKS